MKLSDNPQAAEEVERLLRNWGRWCRVPKVYLTKSGKWAYRWLWFAEQPIFRMYRSPRNRVTRCAQPVNFRDGEKVNDTFIRMSDDELKNLLSEMYANNQPADVLAKMLNVHRATIYRRLGLAKQAFFDEFSK
jgi:hypothetical protein